MVTAIQPLLRDQLIDRRQRLEAATATAPSESELMELLEEVDAALDRMDQGTYGLCVACHDPIETDRLLADPLTRFCLGDLTPKQQHDLEDDLRLAAQIQEGLLPQNHKHIEGWQVAFHYQPAGMVSGDYCDFIDGDNNSIHFVLGDVSGKGVAASMLMAHLHAMFRTLASIKLPLGQMVEQASRVFCESTLPTQYATLVCGRVDTDGSLELCNAGHLPPLLVSNGKVNQLEATGLPLGMFGSESFQVTKLKLEPGDTLFLYTDGLSECTDVDGSEFGLERLSKLIDASQSQSPNDLINTCCDEVRKFAGKPPSDDLTLMAIRRTT
ncbi:MAG: hypothetical protein C5B55_11590 [Blastocatellia bacterium]|nr:MAG: hypothetical protein C5B55_11590 [Blastocatellia bacterium]